MVLATDMVASIVGTDVGDGGKSLFRGLATVLDDLMAASVDSVRQRLEGKGLPAIFRV